MPQSHSMLVPKTLLLAATSLVAMGSVSAADGYTLFNPTPWDKVRELSTYRPDTTESPYTVDAGRFQLELEPLSWTRNKADGVTTTRLDGSANLKAGLTESIDLQLVLGYIYNEESTGTDALDGADDTTVRLKYNVFGNDGNGAALCVMPYITFATHAKEFGSERHVSGGVIVPVAFALPSDWSAAAMFQLGAVRNSADDGYASELTLSITASHAISGELGGFLELVNVTNSEQGSSGQAYFDGGLTYGIGNNLQLDAGFNLGLTKDSEDARLFTGVSVRF